MSGNLLGLVAENKYFGIDRAFHLKAFRFRHPLRQGLLPKDGDAFPEVGLRMFRIELGGSIPGAQVFRDRIGEPAPIVRIEPLQAGLPLPPDHFLDDQAVVAHEVRKRVIVDVAGVR